MKNFLIILSFLFVANYSFAQYPQPYQNLGSLNVVVRDTGGLFVRQTFTPPQYIDTTNANVNPYTSRYPGSMIYTTNDDKFWLRNSTATKWNTLSDFIRGDTLFAQLPAYFDSTTRSPNTILKILQPNGVVSGGTVTVDSCRTLDVIPTIISLNYVQYSSQATTLTVPASDPTFARVDEVIDSLGYIILRTGTPSATPIGAPVNAATEWILASYTMTAGASCVGITQIIVWDENLGSPNEFVLSLLGTISANGNNTDRPQHLTKAIFVTTYESGSSLVFTKSSTLTASPTELLKFWVFLNGTFGSNQFQIQFYNGSTAVGNPVAFGVGYGFNPNDSNEYQNVNIPFSAFNLTNQTFDKIIVTFSGDDLSGAKGLYLDYLQLQNGVTNNSSQLIVTTNFSSGASTYDPITNVLNIPIYSGSSGGRFGIEDNTGVQDRYNSMEGFSMIIDSINRFSINEFNGVNKGFFDMDSTRTRMLNQNDTAEALVLTGIDPSNDNIAVVDLQTTLTEDGNTYLQEIAVNPKFTRFLGTVNGDQRSKVVFEHTDTLLTPPTYMYVSDNDTLKLYPFSGGGSNLANFYLKDSSLSSDRTVDLNGKVLDFSEGAIQLLTINPVTFSAGFIGYDGTAFSGFNVKADLVNNLVNFNLQSNDGTNNVEIFGDAQANTLDYTAETHTFNGSLVYNTPVSGVSTDSVLTWDATSKTVNMRDPTKLVTLQQAIDNSNILTASDSIKFGENLLTIHALAATQAGTPFNIVVGNFPTDKYTNYQQGRNSFVWNSNGASGSNRYASHMNFDTLQGQWYHNNPFLKEFIQLKDSVFLSTTNNASGGHTDLWLNYNRAKIKRSGTGFDGLGHDIVTSVNGLFADSTGDVKSSYSGSFSQVGAATTVFTVTIGTTQANTTYKVNVTPTAALSAALYYVTNKTTTTFDVTYLAGLTGTVTFDWLVSP